MTLNQTIQDGTPVPWSLMAPDPSRKPSPEAKAQDGTDKEDGPFGKDGLTFGDFLDIVNPLHHIPVVSTVYRAITGDEIAPGARLAGATLYGGPVGFVGAAINNAVESKSGATIDEHVIALFDDGEETPENINEPQLARKDATGKDRPANPEEITALELAMKGRQILAAGENAARPPQVPTGISRPSIRKLRRG